MSSRGRFPFGPVVFEANIKTGCFIPPPPRHFSHSPPPSLVLATQTRLRCHSLITFCEVPSSTFHQTSQKPHRVTPVPVNSLMIRWPASASPPHTPTLPTKTVPQPQYAEETGKDSFLGRQSHRLSRVCGLVKVKFACMGNKSVCPERHAYDRNPSRRV